MVGGCEPRIGETGPSISFHYNHCPFKAKVVISFLQE